MAFNAMVATSSASSASAVAFVVPSYDPECCKTSTFGAMCLSPVALRSGTVKANATIRASAAEESKAVRQAMVGILAAGAIMVSGVPALL